MITKSQYDIFLQNIIEDIEGDWVIIGGSLLVLIHASDRTTTDIDICPLNEMTNDMRLNLMTIASKSGLPIEAINPSADFFLRQIPNWKSSLVLFQTGKKGKLFRPSLELYLKLKLNRSSDTDIEDCIRFIEWHKNNSISIDQVALTALLKTYSTEKTDKILKILE